MWQQWSPSRAPRVRVSALHRLSLVGAHPTVRETSYIGPDRRRQPLGGETAVSVSFISAAGVMLAGCLALRVGEGALSTIEIRADVLEASMATATVTLGLGIAVFYLLRWRLVGESRSLRLAVGMTVLSVGVLAPTAVRVAVPTIDPGVLGALQTSCAVVAVAVLARSILAPPIDTGVRPWRTSLVPAVGAVGLAALLAALPVGTWLALGTDDRSSTAGAVGALMWAALGTAYMWRGLRDRRWGQGWAGFMFLGLALHAGEGTGALVVLGGALALAGAGHDLREAWQQQQNSLFQARLDLEVARARDAERQHDARNALFAIDGAASGLGVPAQSLSDADRVALAAALRAEIRRLSDLVAATPDRPAIVAFDVAGVLDPVLACQRQTDLGLRVDIPAGLTAAGRPADLAEAIQAVVENARSHAPGSPVLVRADRELGNVVIRVEDRGPGVPASERESIFERGRRGVHARAGGSGLGLFVARRLMREQAGDVWAEGRPGGGATFVLFLPSARSAPVPVVAEESALRSVGGGR